MSKLFNAVNNETRTENGALAYKSSGNANLDLFFKAGSSRRVDLSNVFLAAFAENADYASRIALWTRDVRGGAGERKQFRNFLKELIRVDVDRARAFITKVPEVGRFDDLGVYFGSELESAAAEFWVAAIQNDNGLAAKWAPRKDSKGAKPLRKALRMNEAQWRKYVVARTAVVEQLMCANKWDEIDYEKVPSLAAARYNAAFNRHDPTRREEYRVALEKGEAKVNAGAVYPYDVVHASRYDAKVSDAQWNSLPNYLEGSDERFLPVVDVSGSMSWAQVSGSITPMDVAVSLGLYLSERNTSIFKDQFVTFDTNPRMMEVKGGDIKSRARHVMDAPWGGSTDLEKVFKMLLRAAKDANLSEEDMPTKILILSDMQFNCVRGGTEETLYQNMQKQFANAGYKLPQVVFWNIAGGRDTGNLPVTMSAGGTALVSGFSPAIMTSLLGGDLDPMSVMLDAIMKDRYAV